MEMSEVFTVKEILKRLESKVDAYHGEMTSRVGNVEGEVKSLSQTFETEKKVLRLFAFIAFLAGGAGGSFLSRMLI